ncbi:hypothetical protein [Dysgonomonas sp. 521]|uniref:hypothetical protein n=1 Tax=Dysgonomonas sp. 521 TaxID=2302932 RepID=UPI0021065EDD|nr:hypothetical protein [Dysgonomonas sp. 521]
MKKEFKKKEVTIEVAPEMAVTTIGLLRGFFPSIMEQVKENELMRSAYLHQMMDADVIKAMQEVLDEIYEKCIAQTSIREDLAGLMELLKDKESSQDDTAN